MNNMREQDYKRIEVLDEQIKKDPHNLNLLMQKAFIHFERYDTPNATETYKHIIQLFPHYIDAYFWLSYYLYQIAADPAQSLEIAQKGLEINQKDARLHAIIAWNYYYGIISAEQFLYHIKKAIELESTWISTRISLIEYYMKQHENDLAKKEIYKALDQIQDNFPVPKDPVEYEYEAGFTRRYDNTARGTLQKWLKDLERESAISQ